MTSSTNTVSEILQAAQITLQGTDSPRLDAELLLVSALNGTRLALLCTPDAVVGDSEIQRFQELLARRLKNEPIAYILGEKEFMGLNFVVGPDVLIPRCDTEFIVEKTLEFLDNESPKTVLDICTGSGCIVLSLAHFCSHGRFFASDISAAALKIAQQNAVRLGLAQQVIFKPGDLLSPFADLREVDLICANPPYITPAEFADLMPDVRDFEPKIALLDPGDGISFHRKILAQARPLLKAGGKVIFEIGHNQKKLIENMERTGFLAPIIIADYAGNDRCVIFERSCGG